jgi:hypothetical protein
MVQKIKLDDQEYEVENLSSEAKATLASLQFATTRMQELTNTHAVLQRAKISYVESIKQEMLSNKAGLLLEDE